MQAPVPEDVDYRQTSARPQWDSLPSHVHEAVGRLAGSAVQQASPAVTTGFTGAYAGRVRLRDGRDVFVKAAGLATPHVHGALEQEARVLAALPHGIPAPDLVGHGDSEDWRLLLLGVIDGHLPGHPWTPAEVEAAHEACLRFAEAGTPAPASLDVGTMAEDLDDARIHSTAQALAEGTFALPHGMPGWLLERGPALADVAGGASRLAGQSLVHGDLRPDNLLVDRRGSAWIVDWNWVVTGPAWLDFTGLLPLMAWQGVDVDALMARSPLFTGSDPEEVDAFLAVIAVYMLSSLDAPPPPGCTPALRQHQHLMARAFLALLERRRGWA
ncbi:phosphotransferase family protein [Oryzihumus leptocrescens]|uniref:Phosphotransferase family enzyme n=1 Tax=Oryzihumus leptocrescens TaxID=297536 RepID=A0A542ZHH1_9MICO|nr:phosphotransferase [Oryzihumus leptocrescens]TQL59798.1 phosphotransferase family enzyme [Oryzihumus leptocrescens]